MRIDNINSETPQTLENKTYTYDQNGVTTLAQQNQYIIDVLKNKLNITDSKLLMEVEGKIVAVKLFIAKESPIKQ